MPGDQPPAPFSLLKVPFGWDPGEPLFWARGRVRLGWVKTKAMREVISWTE